MDFLLRHKNVRFILFVSALAWNSVIFFPMLVPPAIAATIPGLYTYNGINTATTPKAACEQAGSIGGYRVYWQITGVPFTDCPIRGPYYPYLTSGADLGGECLLWIYSCDVRHLRPTISCPTNSTLSNSTCTCNANYKPDPTNTSCISDCPVTALDEITDPVALQYEDGTYDSTNPDIEHLNQATQTGLACIQQKVAALNCYMTPQATSGYRPAAYQKHLFDVYDKWQKLMNDNSDACAEVKAAIGDEFTFHSPFKHAPGATSNHSQLDAQGNPAGNAVDISPVPDNTFDSADTIACQCNMYRPMINNPDPKKNDPVHYEPHTCTH